MHDLHCLRTLPSLHAPLFFFTDTATPEIYTLSLHDALPIYLPSQEQACERPANRSPDRRKSAVRACRARSEEHTSELQSPDHLVCRLLLEKKKRTLNPLTPTIDATTASSQAPHT